MGIGTTELILICIFILLVFGAKRIPELAKALGRAAFEFKKAKADLEKEGKEFVEAAEKAGEAESRAGEAAASDKADMADKESGEAR